MPKAPSSKEIRQRFSDYASDWKDIQDEGNTDMRYVSGDPWEPEDRRQREDAGRPCISLDECTQYLNQWINNIRQNKRAIQVTPQGLGAGDDDANKRAQIIRGIEYRSLAQGAYTCAGENMVNRSYGYARITTGYVSDDSFNQEICIERIPNPNTVLLSPDYKQADASDVEDAFIFNLLRREDFKRKYPKAETKSFTGSHMREAPSWIRENYIQVAEYWKVHTTTRTLLLIDGGELGAITKFEDELKGVKGIKILKNRRVDVKSVVEYVTNGLEQLDEKPWAGSRVPIAACFGKELFIEESGQSKRLLLSMVRLARDPQMLHAFLASQEAEEAGMSPKAPFVGYKGQFESDQEAWETVSKIPRGYLQVDPVVDAATNQVLPLPTRPQFQPNFQAYEIAKESARRSIQAAMGISPLPTAAQRQNEKSGVALDRIQNQEAVGSFHFTDNYDSFLRNIGWQVNELLPIIMDTARDAPGVKDDGSHVVVRLNDPEYAKQNPDKDHLHTDSGEYGVIIDTGPSRDSEREVASDFVDLLVQNLQALPIPPPIATKILALAIKLKNVGPIGKEIAELLSPPDDQDIPPQALQAIQQAKQHSAALNAYAQQLEGELKKLQMEKQAKIVDNEYKLMLTKLEIDGKAAVAEVMTKSQKLDERIKWVEDLYAQLHGQAHELALQKDDQQHQKDLAAQNAQAQQDTQAQAAEQTAAQSQQDQAQQDQSQPQGAGA